MNWIVHLDCGVHEFASAALVSNIIRPTCFGLGLGIRDLLDVHFNFLMAAVFEPIQIASTNSLMHPSREFI